MIRHTVQRTAKKLDHLLSYDIPLSRVFDLLASRARSVEELVVVEVMRESSVEMAKESMELAVQADSNSRSARMPSIALRR